MDQPQDRLARIEHDMRNTVETTRFLPATLVVVAAVSFMLTTFIWRLMHQTTGVEAAVRAGIARSAEADDRAVAEIARLRGDISAQADLTARLERRLERVEANGNATIAGIVTISGDMGDTRRQVLARMVEHGAAVSASRDAVVQEVGSAMQRIEQSLTAQAHDVREQQREIEAAAERARMARQALLHDATQSVSLQIDGLRAILDGLRAEAGETSVAGSRQPEPAATTPASPQTVLPQPVLPQTESPETAAISPEPADATTDTDVAPATPATPTAAPVPATTDTAEPGTTEPEVAARTKDTATN